MPDELSPLPVRCDLSDDESGYGFLLRSSKANGISLDRLMELAGVRSRTWLRLKDIETLAFLTNTAPDALAYRTRQRSVSGGRRVFAFLGCEWMGVEAFRVRSLQVCPDCLKERERCPAVWELTGYCVCVRHHRLLIDRCGRCQRQLGWSRPATDICRCKHYLARTAEQAVANPLLTAWCAWLESRSVGARLLDVAGVLPTWLLPLEPDAAFQLMMALGRRGAEGERISAADGVRAVTPTDMAACVARGLALAPALSDNSALQREAAELIDAARLERLVRFGVDETVRRIARQLLGRMRRPSRLNQIGQPMRNGRATRGQLELFGDDEK